MACIAENESQKHFCKKKIVQKQKKRITELHKQRERKEYYFSVLEQR